MPNSLVVSYEYELKNAIENIIALKDDVIPEKVTFSLYAWPFSRNLVKAICFSKGYSDLFVTRVSKQFEEYTLTGDINLESKIKGVIKIINKVSKETKPDNVPLAKHRNFVTADVLQEMFDFITPMQYSLQCQGKNIFEVAEVAEVADYNDMRASDLRPIAQERKLPGAWKANRLDLIAMLQADDLKGK